MNGAHYHLLVNHLPLIFPIVGVIVLSIGLISKSNAVIRTAYFIFVLGAIAALIAISTGDGAESIIRKLDSNSKSFIKAHEDAANLLAILSYVLAGISLAGLWASFKQKPFSKIIAFVALLFAFVVLFFAQQTGTTGGEIRHTEIRN